MCGDCLIELSQCVHGYYLRRETKVTRTRLDKAGTAVQQYNYQLDRSTK